MSLYWIRLLAKKKKNLSHDALATTDQEQLWFAPVWLLRRHWTVKTEWKTFTWKNLGCCFIAIFFSSVFPFFVQQNRSSEGLTCIAGGLLIIFVIFWLHVFTLIVCPLCGVGHRLHWAVGVHQNGLKRQTECWLYHMTHPKQNQDNFTFCLTW